jgi:hypothetical protein
MKKATLFLILLFITSYFAGAQDIITLKSGDELNVKIIRLNAKDVQYSPHGVSDTISIWRDDVVKLQYNTGTIVYLTDDKDFTGYQSATQDSMYNAGVNDASKYYSGYSGAAIGTLVSSIAFPYNIIPAIACSVTKPKDQNLGYRDYKLMQNSSYSRGYVNQAHKIKRNKVWKNYAIGSGVMIGFYIILGVLAESTMVY